MNRPGFTFDDVSVSPNRQIGRHSHPQWELSLVKYGKGIRTIGDHAEPMEEGEIILIPPNIPHVWQFDQSHTDADGNIANISVFFDTWTLDSLSVAIPEFAGTINRLKSRTEAIMIKEETGFANITYFNRLFRRKFNCTPKSIRMNYDKVEIIQNSI